MNNRVELTTYIEDAIPAMELQVGDIATITKDEHSFGHCGSVVARRWDWDYKKVCIVNIANPGTTWVNPSFNVRKLQPGEQVTITIERDGGE